MLDAMPRPDLAAASAAAAAIANRRAVTHDPDLDRLPDPDDLLNMAAYPHRYRQVAGHILAADLADAWTILQYLSGAIDYHQVALLDAARDAAITYSAIAAALGVASRQAAEATHCRLRAAQAGHAKDERPARAAARHLRNTGRLVQSATVAARWLTGHRAELPAGYREDLDDLAVVLERPGPGLVATVRLLVGDLLGDPAVTGWVRELLEATHTNIES